MAAGKAVQESVNSSASSTAGTMHLKCLIKPPAQPVVLDSAANTETAEETRGENKREKSVFFVIKRFTDKAIRGIIKTEI